MVDKDGVLKYIDFGLAVPYRKEFGKPGNRTGTPNYLAPELIKRQTTDHRVDLFALGVTAYEVFTGDLPWERAQSLETVMSHLNSPGQDPRKLHPEIDDQVATFLLKAVERDPNKRFQTAKAFRDALQAMA
jgi:serine/threonine protein kinase